jgi:cytochrome P450
LVALDFASANLDPEAFEDPRSCILDRWPDRPLPFGHGIHRCVGAPLAQLELSVVLEELLAQSSSFEQAGEVVRGNVSNRPERSSHFPWRSRQQNNFETDDECTCR